MRKERNAKIPSNAVVVLICIGMMVSGGLMLKNYRDVFIDELAAPLSTRSGPSVQPIRIRSNKIELKGNSNEVIKGTGLTEDPYIIENQLFFGQSEDNLLIRDSNVSIVIRNCNFQGIDGTRQAAISIQNSEFVRVENCTFRGFYRGIEIMESQFVSIAKSNITRCDCGLYIYNSLFVTIEDNNFGFNKKIGITMVMSGFCTIARNYLYYSASVSPFNSMYELSLESNSSNNWIFHNYFETKSKAVSPILCSKDSTHNTFYQDKRGNYYGYYNSQKNARINDGIYDMAFVIKKDANAIDPYPIANPNRPELITLGVNPLWVPFVWICFALHVLIGLIMKKQFDIFAKKYLTSILMVIPFGAYFLQLEILFSNISFVIFFVLPTRIILKPRGPFAERVLDPLREMFLIIALGIIIALYHTVEPWALILIFNGIYLWVVYKDYGAIFNKWFKELSKDQKNAEQTKEEKVEETKTTEDQVQHLIQYIENLKNRVSIIEESELLEELVEKSPGLKKSKILRIMKRSGITISKNVVLLQPLYLDTLKERLLKMAQKKYGIVRLNQIWPKARKLSQAELGLFMDYLSNIGLCFEIEPNVYLFSAALHASHRGPATLPEDLRRIIESGVITETIEVRGPAIRISEKILNEADKIAGTKIYRGPLSGLWSSGFGKERTLIEIMIYLSSEGGFLILKAAGGKREALENEIREKIYEILGSSFFVQKAKRKNKQ